MTHTQDSPIETIQGAPLIVSGPGRSGTTFMLFLLSRHPQMQVFGQPILTLADWAAFLQKLDTTDATASDWNQKPWVRNYQEPHYAGGVPGTYDDKVADLVRAHYTGIGNRGKPQWGLKSIWSCSSEVERAFVDRAWKGRARWLICVREPFATLESVRGTFAPQMLVDGFMTLWIESVKFSRRRGAPLVQLDLLQKLGTKERVLALEGAMERVGLPVSVECRAFIQEWPAVHADIEGATSASVSQSDRAAALESLPELRSLMESLGYTA